MTAPLDLDAIRARAEAATGGPWTVEIHGGAPVLFAGRTDGDGDIFAALHGLNLMHLTEGDWNFSNNLDFIAHARTDVPILLAEVERLREIVGPLDPVISDEQVADEIRAAGGDPEAIGKRGAALADALIEVARLAEEVERLRGRVACARAYDINDVGIYTFGERWRAIWPDGSERIFPSLDAAWAALDAARKEGAK